MPAPGMVSRHPAHTAAAQPAARLPEPRARGARMDQQATAPKQRPTTRPPRMQHRVKRPAARKTRTPSQEKQVPAVPHIDPCRRRAFPPQGRTDHNPRRPRHQLLPLRRRQALHRRRRRLPAPRLRSLQVRGQRLERRRPRRELPHRVRPALPPQDHPTRQTLRDNRPRRRPAWRDRVARHDPPPVTILAQVAPRREATQVRLQREALDHPRHPLSRRAVPATPGNRLADRRARAREAKGLPAHLLPAARQAPLPRQVHRRRGAQHLADRLDVKSQPPRRRSLDRSPALQPVHRVRRQARIPARLAPAPAVPRQARLLPVRRVNRAVRVNGPPLPRADRRPVRAPARSRAPLRVMDSCRVRQPRRRPARRAVSPAAARRPGAGQLQEVPQAR